MDKLVYNSLNNYFNRLEGVGYVPYDNVNYLLVLTFIHKFINNMCLTDELMSVVNRALQCVKNKNCVILNN